MKIYKLSQSDERNNKLPTAEELIYILKNHPLVKNIGRVKNIYLVGSFAKGTQNENSDIDILIEIYPVKGMAAEEFAENKRNQIRNYFVKNDIRNRDDSVHPQWNGRRIDIYFTYDASIETNAKIKL